jgi:hypothetical protein
VNQNDCLRRNTVGRQRFQAIADALLARGAADCRFTQSCAAARQISNGRSVGRSIVLVDHHA